MEYKSDIITLAVVNFKVAAGNKKANLRRMLDMAKAAANRGAELILFPEMCLMGYDYFVDENIPREEKVRVTETLEGPSVKALEKIAVSEGIYIVFGMSEKKTDDSKELYNSAVALGPEGLIGVYRKIHPFGAENTWCMKGDEPFMFDTKWDPISIGICYDNYQFPELVRYYVYKGARLHLNPTAACEEIGKEGSRTAFIRYYESHLQYLVTSSYIYVASSNLTGWDKASYFGGGSMVIGPKTSAFYETDVTAYIGDAGDCQAKMFIGTIDLSLAERRQCIDNKYGGGSDYRPEIYKKLFNEIG